MPKGSTIWKNVLESKSQGLKMERTELTPTLEEPPNFFNGSKLRPEVLFKKKKPHKSGFLLVLDSFTGAWFSNWFSQGETTIVTKGDNQFNN